MPKTRDHVDADRRLLLLARFSWISEPSAVRDLAKCWFADRPVVEVERAAFDLAARSRRPGEQRLLLTLVDALAATHH